jgi:hypothetical protein
MDPVGTRITAGCFSRHFGKGEPPIFGRRDSLLDYIEEFSIRENLGHFGGQ